MNDHEKLEKIKQIREETRDSHSNRARRVAEARIDEILAEVHHEEAPSHAEQDAPEEGSHPTPRPGRPRKQV